MTKYHISKETGRPNICRADKKPCPLGSDAPHFDNKQEAREHAEKILTEEYGATSSVAKKRIYGMNENAFKKSVVQWKEKNAIQVRIDDLKDEQRVLKKSLIELDDALPDTDSSPTSTQIKRMQSALYDYKLNSDDPSDEERSAARHYAYPNSWGEDPDPYDITKKVEDSLGKGKLKFSENEDDIVFLEREVERINKRLVERGANAYSNPRFGVETEKSARDISFDDEPNIEIIVPPKDIPVLENAEKVCGNCAEKIVNNGSSATHENGEIACAGGNGRQFASHSSVCRVCGTSDPNHISYSSSYQGSRLSGRMHIICARCRSRIEIKR